MDARNRNSTRVRSACFLQDCASGKKKPSLRSHTVNGSNATSCTSSPRRSATIFSCSIRWARRQIYRGFLEVPTPRQAHLQIPTKKRSIAELPLLTRDLASVSGVEGRRTDRGRTILHWRAANKSSCFTILRTSILLRSGSMPAQLLSPRAFYVLFLPARRGGDYKFL